LNESGLYAYKTYLNENTTYLAWLLSGEKQITASGGEGLSSSLIYTNDTSEEKAEFLTSFLTEVNTH